MPADKSKVICHSTFFYLFRFERRKEGRDKKIEQNRRVAIRGSNITKEKVMRDEKTSLEHVFDLLFLKFVRSYSFK